MYLFFSSKNGRGQLIALTLRPTIITALIFALALCFSTQKSMGKESSYQLPKITLTLKNTTLSNIFSEIEKQSKYGFVYNSELIKDLNKIDISVKEAPLDVVMDRCLAGQPLTYKIEEATKLVILVRKPLKEMTKEHPSVDTTITVTGQVRAASTQSSLPGVTVLVKGSIIGTSTDENGRFLLNRVNSNAILVVRSIGFLTQEVPLKGEDNLFISLVEDAQRINEVAIVSTGYQEIPKDHATGSFVQLDNKVLNRGVSTNILNRLVGITSGLNFSPRPVGASSDITIRGISTILANQKPLIVVDGFPYEDDAINNLSGQINNVNPNDIESITILKDAAAASIWGARSGNGVIVITTKKGKYNQKPLVKLASNISILAKPDLFYVPRMSSSDQIELETDLFNKSYYDSYLNDRNTYPAVSEVVELLEKRRKNQLTDTEVSSKIERLKAQDVRNDITKYLQQTEINQQYSLSISGGNTRNSYYASAGLDKNRSSNTGSDYSRITARIDDSFKPINRLLISTFLSYTQSDRKLNSIDIRNSVSPYASLIDENGNPKAIQNNLRLAYIDTVSFPALLDWHYKPLDELNLLDSNSKQYDLRIGTGLKYKVTDGLDLEIKYQYHRLTTSNTAYYDPQSYTVRNLVNKFMSINRGTGQLYYPIPLGAIYDRSLIETVDWNFRGQVNFNKSFGIHGITAVAGTDIREVNSGSNSLRLYGYDREVGTYFSQINYDSLFLVRPSNGARERVSSNNNNSLTISRFLSYYANASYTILSKYTISGSGRMDGSNFFGIKANQRVVPLWSLGASWDISKEHFYNVVGLPFLRLKASYGFNGNMRNDATAYPIIRYTLPSSTSLTTDTYARIESPGNPELKWEKVRMLNLSVEFATKNDRVSGSLEFYNKRGIDLLGQIIINSTTGFATFTGNTASIKGKGIDFSVTTKNIQRKLSWNSTLLFSYNTDRVLEYESPLTSPSAFILGVVPGKPLYSVLAYRFAGLNASNGDPMVLVSDTVASFSTAYNAAKESDLTFLGSRNPLLFGSLRNDITWNNLTISFNIVYKLKYAFRKSSIQYASLLTTYSRGGHPDYNKRWQKSGDELTTTIPSIPAANNSIRDDVYMNSDILVLNASHVRFQDLRLAYTIDQKLVKRFPVSSLQIFSYINNMGLIWTANKYHIDPDYGDSNVPIPRSYSFGIVASF